MPLTVHLHDIENRDLELDGEIPVAELELDERDPVVHPRHPLRYDLHVSKLGTEILLEGVLEITLDCECVRCLKPFPQTVRLEGPLLALPLEGEEAVPVEADAVDLTPHLREHILLEFPPHPLCKPDCGGLVLGAGKRKPRKAKTSSGDSGSPWDQLDQLKL